MVVQSGGAGRDATFNNAGGTAVTNSNLVNIGSIQFTAAPNAQAFAFILNNTFIVNGTGIFNNSTNTQTFEVTSGNAMVFQSGTAPA
jgi:hypothetical protein